MNVNASKKFVYWLVFFGGMMCSSITNGFIPSLPTITMTTTKTTLLYTSEKIYSPRQRHQPFLEHYRLTTTLFGSKNTIPKSKLSPKKRLMKKKKNTVSEFTVDNDTNNESDDEEEDTAEEFLELQLIDDSSNNILDDKMALSTLVEVATVEVAPITTATSSTISRSSSTTTTTTTTTSNSRNSKKVKVQYGAFEPGTVVQIEVGDISRARKAWKKRRRSDSPLLIPCSILHVDHISTIRYNCIYLLEKFGTATTHGSSTSSSSNGIRISLTELSIRFRTHLKSSLLYHATTLGYNNSFDLISSIFHKQVQDAYGVQLLTTTVNDKESIDSQEGVHNSQQQQLYLETPLSRARAHSRAASAAILQFTDNDTTTDVLDHTGLVRIKKQQSQQVQELQQQQQQSIDMELTMNDALNTELLSETSENEKNKNSNVYSLVPLSVALRVSSEDVLESLVYNGSRHAAVVFDYDITGDAGVLPLITLSLNPQRNQVRDRFKQKNNKKLTTTATMRRSNKKGDSTTTSMKWFHELKIGDGPYTGKVVRLVKGGAIVDCNVYRVRKQQQLAASVTKESSLNEDIEFISKDNIPVFGVLRFKDAVLSDNNVMTAPTIDMDDTTSMDDDEDDEDWNEIFSIDELNNFDDEDEDIANDSLDISDDDDENETDYEDEETAIDNLDIDDEDEDESDYDNDGEVLAAFNLENDDEFAEGEDITHLFNIKDDGTLEYTDPETGITQVISGVNIQDEHDDDDSDEEIDDDDDAADDITAEFDDDVYDEDDEDDDDDRPVLLSSFGQNAGKAKKSYTELSIPKYRTQTLRVGESVDVYMKLISKQSNQLLLSMDASIQGKKAKDMKKETDVSKKLNRLIKQLGGYQRLRELNGTICNGTIKAISNTGGNWYYVQPDLINIPVGIATLTSQLSNNDDDDDDKTNDDTHIWNVGDIVQIQLNGIDPDRGQLSMSIIGDCG